MTTARRRGRTPARANAAGDLLKTVIDEINTFEAKKLGELKTELEAFVKKQDDVEKGYEKAVSRRSRDKWCAQQQTIETLYAAIKCAFPRPGLEERSSRRCICAKRREVRCREQDSMQRRRCCWGTRERAASGPGPARRGQGAARHAGRQRAEGRRRAQGQRQADRPDPRCPAAAGRRRVALYLFWFKLLPAHRQLMPGDVGDDCKKFGDDESPEKLCESTYKKPCDRRTRAAVHAAGSDSDDADGDMPASTRGTRCRGSIDPTRYRQELDCAWDDCVTRRRTFAEAEADFKAARRSQVASKRR